MTVICPYCKNPATLVTGDIIYPHRQDLFHLFFWRCEDCDAYVGTHRDSREHRPLGRLADAVLRRAKQDAHRAFDPLWQKGPRTRQEAYQWLAHQLGIKFHQCHIGEFDANMCRKVVRACVAVEEGDQE